MMRAVTLILFLLILLLQYPLWLGKGGWMRVYDLGKQLDAQKAENQKTQERNALMDAEVHDLKQGTEAIEGYARSRMGMIKQGEIFFQIVDTPQPAPTSSVIATPEASSGKD